MKALREQNPTLGDSKQGGHSLIGGLVVTLMLSLLVACASPPQVLEKSPSYVADRAPVESPLERLLPPPEASKSGVLLLADPFDALQARLHLVEAASSSLDLQYYLWQGDIVGRALTEAFLRAADRGVRVRLLLDDIYHSGRDEIYQTLDSHPNIQLRLFNPMGNRGALKTVNYALRKAEFNHRMHNKIFLADGLAAVMGGRNIGDEYFGLDESFNFQDLDVLVTGGGAEEAGEAFDQFWNATLSVPIDSLYPDTNRRDSLSAREELVVATDTLRTVLANSDAYAPNTRAWIESTRSSLTWADTRVIVDNPDRGPENIDTAFSIFATDPRLRPDREVTIQTAYLIPNGPTMDTLGGLAARGVTISILTNSAASNNHGTVHAYYMPYRTALIQAGISLYELQATGDLSDYLSRTGAMARAGLHTKAMVIDNEVSVIGSYNMDPRSRVWNTEIALIVFSDSIAEAVHDEMSRDFDPAAAWCVTLDEKDRLIWRGKSDGEVVSLEQEPGIGWWQRFLWSLLRLLPLENEM